MTSDKLSNPQDPTKYQYLVQEDPRIRELESQGWLQIGLWNGEHDGMPISGPILEAPKTGDGEPDQSDDGTEEPR